MSRSSSNRRRKHRDRLLGNSGTCPCYHCGGALISETITLDHLVPLSKGGTWDADNVVACCGPCNGAKGSRKTVNPRLRNKIAAKCSVTKLFVETKRLRSRVRGLKVYSTLYKTIVRSLLADTYEL